MMRYRGVVEGLERSDREIEEELFDEDNIRTTGHKTPGESSVILQIVVIVQLTSKRILRD